MTVRFVDKNAGREFRYLFGSVERSGSASPGTEVPWRLSSGRHTLIWSLAIERGVEAVPLIDAITVLPGHEESAEDLVSLAARAGLAWLEERSREGDSLGQLVGYSVAIEP